MRSFIYDLLRNDPTLRSLGVASTAVYTGDVDTPPERPFLNLRWGVSPIVPSIAAVGPRQLVVWVHDAPNDYTNIDAIIRQVKTLFLGVVGARHSFGYITQIEWNGDSEDGRDNGFDTIFRNTAHTIIGTGF